MTNERLTTTVTYNYGSGSSITITLSGKPLNAFENEHLLFDLAMLGTSAAQAHAHPEITLGDMADAIADHSGMMHQLAEARQREVLRVIQEQDTRADELRAAPKAADELRHDVDDTIKEFIHKHHGASRYFLQFLDDLQVKLRD